jgi:hypothetical protein
VLALEVARAAALDGKRVLLTCFNIALARWIAETVASWGPLAERVRVATFHDLCREAAAALGAIPGPPAPGDKAAADDYWGVRLPERLRAALAAGGLSRYDAVIVYEGQDFRRGWFDLLEGLLREPRGGTLVIFHDPAQDIFGTGCCSPVSGSDAGELPNTRAIAGYLNSLAAGAAPFSRTPREPPASTRPLAGIRGPRHRPSR